MSVAIEVPSTRRSEWLVPLTCFAVVLGMQLWLVAAAGTDVPFYDQWDLEGRWLYPGWMDGSVGLTDLVRAHNEHRIVWTHILNIGLFEANGRRWDPLVQMVANAVLHAGCAALLGWLVNGVARYRWVLVAAVIVLSVPLAGWHNALWGFQSQFYFLEMFVLLACIALTKPAGNSLRMGFGLLALGAACWAMGAGSLLPLALLGAWMVRALDSRRRSRVFLFEGGGWLLLNLGAWWLRPIATGPNELQAGSVAQFFEALGRMLAWPHVGQPWATVVMILPFFLLIGLRVLRRRTAAVGEAILIPVGVWACLAAGAAAWARGGSQEFFGGVPSRYADFLALLPLVNLWALTILVGEMSPLRLQLGRLLAGCWLGFLLMGWLGLSGEMWRRVVVPRSRDREAPVRLVQAFQRSDDTAVFRGQPRLLVPHPDLESVRAVLRDPRMQGSLPPSLQPDQPMGPLSQAVRWLLRRPSP